MTGIWVPEFMYKPLGRAGGTYDRRAPMKICWHTWEGTNWDGAESTFHRYPPHIGMKYPDQPRQYVDLARHSYAFKGSESDDEPIIQIEVAGFARDMRDKPDVFLAWLAAATDAINRALHRAGWDTVDPTVPPDGFRDEQDRAWAPLASARSRLRFTDRELETYRGHLGHQHVPAPDSHWDPGALDVARMLSFCRFNPTGSAPPSEEDDMTPEERQWLKEAHQNSMEANVRAAAVLDIVEEIAAETIGPIGKDGLSRQDRFAKILDSLKPKG